MGLIKFRFSLLLVGSFMLATMSSPASAQSVVRSSASPIGACGPINGLRFVCGLKNPEDLALVPGTRWIVASSLAPGGGLHLVDTDAHVARPLRAEGEPRSRPDFALYPNCSGPPDPATFISHGLAVRPTATPGRYRLYVVSHDGGEKVQVFALDARGDTPTLGWSGCVPLPGGMKGAAVTAFSDGTILATVRGGSDPVGARTGAGGVDEGAVAAWTPGDARFHVLPGTEMPGPHGLEVLTDERAFYVASSGNRTVTAFSRADSKHSVQSAVAPLASLDNLRFTGGHLIAAGMMFDEPACGGTREQIAARGGDPHACVRGYAAVELDPATMAWTVVAYGEPNPVFGGVATAVPVGGSLWLSSFNADRVAYRPLPGNQ